MSKISVFLALTLLSLVVSTPASAYYLVKMEKNNLVVYQGAVLGDDDSADAEEKEVETPEVKTEEQKTPEQEKLGEVRKDSPTAGNRQNEIKRAINEVRKTEKREDQLEKKNQLNKAKKQVIIDPKTSTLFINQLTPENGKKIEELKNRREELQTEMDKKGKKLTVKERREFEKKIKENQDAEERLGSTNIQKIEKEDALEIESGKMKIRLEERTEDRQREILKKRLEERRKEDKRGGEMEKREELENETEVETDDDTDSKEIEIEDGSSRVRTDLPVGINADSGDLVIATDGGSVTTSNTPSRVLERLRSKKVIDGFSSDSQGESTSEIVMEEDKPVYNIKGTRKARLFGFVPVNFEKEVKVDAETGDVIETNQGGFSKFFERFSL